MNVNWNILQGKVKMIKLGTYQFDSIENEKKLLDFYKEQFDQEEDFTPAQAEKIQNQIDYFEQALINQGMIEKKHDNKKWVYEFAKYCLDDEEFNRGGIPTEEKNFLNKLGWKIGDVNLALFYEAVGRLYDLQKEMDK